MKQCLIFIIPTTAPVKAKLVQCVCFMDISQPAKIQSSIVVSPKVMGRILLILAFLVSGHGVAVQNVQKTRLMVTKNIPRLVS